MRFKTVLCVLLAAMCALASAASAAPAALQYYIISDGTNWELTDIEGNAPQAVAGRRLDGVYALTYVNGNGDVEILGYSLSEPVTSLEEAPSNDWSGYTRRALLDAGGALLRDFQYGVSDHYTVGRYILQSTSRVVNGQYQWSWTLIDPATGKDVDLLPGRRPDSVAECGDGFLVTVNGAPDDAAPSEDEQERDKAYMQANTVYYVDARLRTMFSIRCSYAEARRWGDTWVILARETGAVSNAYVLYDLKGKKIAGPLDTADINYNEESGEVIAGIDGKLYVLNMDTGTLAPAKANVWGYTGGLAMEYGEGGARVVDKAGREVLPGNEGDSYLFYETTPILASRYDYPSGVWRYAVYARDGKVLADWAAMEGFERCGLLESSGAAYASDGNVLKIFDAKGERRFTLKLPAGARIINVSEACGKLAATIYAPEETELDAYYTSFLSESMELLEPKYAYVFPVADGPMAGGAFVHRIVRGKDLRGLLDAEGNEVIPCRYELLWERGDLLAAAGGSWYGLVDYNGHWVLRKSRYGVMGD